MKPTQRLKGIACSKLTVELEYRENKLFIYDEVFHCMNEGISAFYDNMSEYYHLIFADWQSSVDRQATIFDRLLEVNGMTKRHSILDCACGIGTQALGLAKLGYHVSGSDISKNEIERAIKEADVRNLHIDFKQADFSNLQLAFNQSFDIVMAIDNALPHLIHKEDLKQALMSIYSTVNDNGIFIASIRDYDEILKTKPTCPTPYIIPTPTGKRIAFQLWDWNEDVYHFTQYIIEDENEDLHTHKFSCSYRAITRIELTQELETAGFREVEWLFAEKSGFYQPIVIATK
jgi:glycine/sarcosine N-methyltransferase